MADPVYRLAVWSCGAFHFAAGQDPVSFVERLADATLYTEKDARAIQKRFGKSRAAKMRLKLEQAAAPPEPKPSEPLSDAAKRMLLFD